MGASGRRRARRCLRAARPLARHLFTTRDVAARLRRRRHATTDWAPVARVARRRSRRISVRARQVHGAAVVVRRAGDPPRAGVPLPEADIIVSDDPLDRAGDPDGRLRAAADRRSPDRRGRGRARRLARPGRECARVSRAALSRASSAARPADLVVAVGPSIGAAATKSAPMSRERFDRAGFRQTSSSRAGFSRRRARRPLALRRLGVRGAISSPRPACRPIRSIRPASARPPRPDCCARIGATASAPVGSPRIGTRCSSRASCLIFARNCVIDASSDERGAARLDNRCQRSLRPAFQMKRSQCRRPRARRLESGYLEPWFRVPLAAGLGADQACSSGYHSCQRVALTLAAPSSPTCSSDLKEQRSSLTCMSTFSENRFGGTA